MYDNKWIDIRTVARSAIVAKLVARVTLTHKRPHRVHTLLSAVSLVAAATFINIWRSHHTRIIRI